MQVFGFDPCQKQSKLHTDALAEECMRFMQASDDSALLLQKYTYNLAILVRHLSLLYFQCFHMDNAYHCYSLEEILP